MERFRTNGKRDSSTEISQSWILRTIRLNRGPTGLPMQMVNSPWRAPYTARQLNFKRGYNWVIILPNILFHAKFSGSGLVPACKEWGVGGGNRGHSLLPVCMAWTHRQGLFSVICWWLDSLILSDIDDKGTSEISGSDHPECLSQIHIHIRGHS